jgi:hypothetical protein
MLMTLTVGFNFINILRAAFKRADSKSIKKIQQLDSLFISILCAKILCVTRALDIHFRLHLVSEIDQWKIYLRNKNKQ